MADMRRDREQPKLPPRHLFHQGGARGPAGMLCARCGEPREHDCHEPLWKGWIVLGGKAGY